MPYKKAPELIYIPVEPSEEQARKVSEAYEILFEEVLKRRRAESLNPDNDNEKKE